MARWSHDRGSFFLSISPAIAQGLPNVNQNTTPANNGAAATTGAGDEIAFPPYYGGTVPYHITWSVRSGGSGSFSARTVNLEGSLDGTNWDIIDSITDPIGGSKTVPMSTYRYLRCNIPSAPTVVSGAPTTTAGISI